MVVFRLPLWWTVVATLGPTLAALITHRLSTGSYSAFRIYTRWVPMIVASALGAGLIVLGYVVLPALVTADPSQLQWGILLSTSVYNYSTLLGGPLLEEPGWRGYALPRLQALHGPVRSSLLLGLLWTGWHLPLFLYPGWTSSTLWTYVLFVTSESIILSCIANLGQLSIIPPIVTHAMFNTVSRFLGGLFATTQPATPVRFDLVMALGGCVVALVLILVTRGRLGYRAELTP
jgi:membrane protease YdiL (CAAX protease family)